MKQEKNGKSLHIWKTEIWHARQSERKTGLLISDIISFLKACQYVHLKQIRDVTSS